MIDKKKLIEELLDCVADATDTETQITNLTMAGMLMNEVIDEALTIPAVVGQSEQLVSFLRQLPCGDLMKHNFSLSKIGRCITCDRAKEKAR